IVERLAQSLEREAIAATSRGADRRHDLLQPVCREFAEPLPRSSRVVLLTERLQLVCRLRPRVRAACPFDPVTGLLVPEPDAYDVRAVFVLPDPGHLRRLQS